MKLINKPTLFSSIILMVLSIGSAHGQYATNSMNKDDKVTSSRGFSDVIKSVGSNGKVMYSDHMVNGYKETKRFTGVDFVDPPKNVSETPNSEVASQSNIVKLAIQTQSDIDKTNKKIEEANLAAKQTNCNNAKQSLAGLSVGGRIVRLKQDGSRYYLSDDEISSEKEKTLEIIKASCPNN